MEQRRSHFVTLGSVLQDVLARLKLPDDALLEVIRLHWHEAAGALVAEHAQPERVDHGVLYVRVKSHLWLQELRRGLGRQVQEKLAAASGINVRTVRWQQALDAH